MNESYYVSTYSELSELRAATYVRKRHLRLKRGVLLLPYLASAEKSTMLLLVMLLVDLLIYVASL